MDGRGEFGYIADSSSSRRHASLHDRSTLEIRTDACIPMIGPLLARWGAALGLISTAAAAAPRDLPFADADVARWHDLTADSAGARAGTIDTASWTDLLMPAFLVRLASGVSIFGQQHLYRDLRSGSDEAARENLRMRQEALDADPHGQAAIAGVCRPLRDAEVEIADLLYGGPAPAAPSWAGWGWLLTLGLLASIAAVALTPLAWIPVFVVLYYLITLQLHYQPAMEHAALQRRSVQMMLRACSLAMRSNAASGLPALAPLAALGRQAGVLNRALGASQVASLPGVSAYLDWFMLRNVEHYFKTSSLIARERAFLQECFHCCAELEADLALARERARAARWCWARMDAAITLIDAIHPLLAAPVPLSLAAAGGGVFLSGQNGIGKSTLLRTVGVNLLVARAFGFCYATEALVPMTAVYASMQSEDSLLTGDSLYIAELKRARELLAMADGGERAVFLIDEIFRGTNHHESVAAAAAVLDRLASANLVLVSSHNLVLAQLLAHRLAPRCIVRMADGALALQPGVLAQTNGVALLAAHGFDVAVVIRAQKVAAWLDRRATHPGGAAASTLLSSIDSRAA
jgi:hypothetical protein